MAEVSDFYFRRKTVFLLKGHWLRCYLGHSIWALPSSRLLTNVWPSLWCHFLRVWLSLPPLRGDLLRWLGSLRPDWTSSLAVIFSLSLSKDLRLLSRFSWWSSFCWSSSENSMEVRWRHYNRIIMDLRRHFVDWLRAKFSCRCWNLSQSGWFAGSVWQQVSIHDFRCSCFEIWWWLSHLF